MSMCIAAAMTTAAKARKSPHGSPHRHLTESVRRCVSEYDRPRADGMHGMMLCVFTIFISHPCCIFTHFTHMFYFLTFFSGTAGRGGGLVIGGAAARVAGNDGGNEGRRQRSLPMEYTKH